jgi:uncharacterized membrane protein YkoI
MKRAALLLAALSLVMTTPASAAVRALKNNNGPAIAAAIAGGIIGVELAQQHNRRDDRQDDRRDEPQADVRARISPAQAEAAVNRVTPGRMLNIEQVNREGRPYWRIRWQTKDGRLVNYLVDGTSGVIAGGG